MTNRESLTYAGSGVDYDAMDPFKRQAQEAARLTADNLAIFRELEEVGWSRGESVYLVHDPVRECYWGHVHEGLGTRNVVADVYAEQTGKEWYHPIGYSSLAVGLNDAATLGVRPTTVTQHLAVGSSDWFKNQGRVDSFIEGWTQACQDARATWAGGETPTLKDILLPTAAEISCSVHGIVEPESNLIDGDIPEGATIMLLGSSGIHDNGLTLGRQIGDMLTDRYLTRIDGGTTYGEALLVPTTLYGPIVEACQDEGVKIHYAVNITGHGWRKLMRSTRPLRYVIERVPEPQPVFRFIQERGNVTTEEMYGNYNMGAGFAFFVDKKAVETVSKIADEYDGVLALEAGYVERSEKGKSVVIEPLGIEWTGKALQVR